MDADVHIEIHNGLARIVRHSILGEGPLDAIAPLLETRVPILTPVLPRSSIMHWYDDSNPRNRKIRLLCEIQPGIKPIIKSGRRYRLAMPWTYFLFGLTNSNSRDTQWGMDTRRVFHSRERVIDGNSVLIPALLPNVDENAVICFGSTGTNPNQPLADFIDTLVNQWYATAFNNDLVAGRLNPRPYGAANWRPWVDATQQRGVAAYLDWPEFEPTHPIRKWTVSDLMQNPEHAITVTTVTDAIPEIPVTPTFGRADQAILEWNPVQRHRIFTALSFHAEEEGFFEVPPEEPAANLEDDGGEPI